MTMINMCIFELQEKKKKATKKGIGLTSVTHPHVKGEL